MILPTKYIQERFHCSVSAPGKHLSSVYFRFLHAYLSATQLEISLDGRDENSWMELTMRRVEHTSFQSYITLPQDASITLPQDASETHNYSTVPDLWDLSGSLLHRMLKANGTRNSKQQLAHHLTNASRFVKLRFKLTRISQLEICWKRDKKHRGDIQLLLQVKSNLFKFHGQTIVDTQISYVQKILVDTEIALTESEHCTRFGVVGVAALLTVSDKNMLRNVVLYVKSTSVPDIFEENRIEFVKCEKSFRKHMGEFICQSCKNLLINKANLGYNVLFFLPKLAFEDSVKLSWRQSYDLCDSAEGHLPVIRSSEELHMLASLVTVVVHSLPVTILSIAFTHNKEQASTLAHFSSATFLFVQFLFLTLLTFRIHFRG